jgi:hypothetical protein
MSTDERGNNLSASDWDAFAKARVAELRQRSSETDGPNDEHDVGQSVTQMSFTAIGEQQWGFLLAAVKYSESDA